MRYLVDMAPAGGRRRAGLFFTRAKVAVYVDGCFWHRCPIHGTVPKANREWWLAKLDANVRRDRDTDARLRDGGGSVLRFWEHDAPDVGPARLAMSPGESSRRLRGVRIPSPRGARRPGTPSRLGGVPARHPDRYPHPPTGPPRRLHRVRLPVPPGLRAIQRERPTGSARNWCPLPTRRHSRRRK